MAKSKSSSPKKKSERQRIKDFGSLVWILNNLSDDELSHMDSQEFDAGRFCDFLEGCVDNGLDVKFSWDNYSSSYSVQAMGAWEGFHNSGMAVSARSVDVFDAAKVLWFKISFMCEFDLTQYREKARERGKRG